MSCQDLRRLLSRWLDGELDPAEREAVASHLGDCERCRAEVEQMRTLRTELKTVMTPPAVSESEWDSVALRVVSRQSERLGFVLMLPAVAALFTGALVSFFTAPDVPLWVRIAFGAATAGLTFLILAAAADRWQARRTDRYERVER